LIKKIIGENNMVEESSYKPTVSKIKSVLEEVSDDSQIAKDTEQDEFDEFLKDDTKTDKQKREVMLGRSFLSKDYLSENFDHEQLKQIRLGLKNKLSVEKYAKKYYNWKQMKEIRLGLESGINVDLYLSPYFSSKQMREIRLGLEDGIDVSSYLSEDISAAKMKKIRKDLTYNKKEK